MGSICISLPAQDPKNAQAMEQVQALARQHRTWGPAITSPGVTIETKEISRQDVKGQTAVKYHAFIHGLPKEKSYTLLHWPVNGQLMTFFDGGIRIGEKDIVYTVADGEPLELILFAGLGEPKRFGLVSIDGKSRAAFILVPHPFRGEDKGCTLEAELLTADSEALFIRGSGFAPNTEVGFESSSEGEEHQGKLKSGGDGTVSTVILPYVLGKERGKVQIRVVAEKCSPQVSVPWGKGTYKVQ
jgi:hypothetical protein